MLENRLFYYNPVSINETTRKFFHYLQTLHLYKHDDPTFENDPKIIARKEWKHGNLWHNQKEQLEEWTKLKCGEVLFNSDVDDWGMNTSVFGDRVVERRNLIFVIEDTENNKFGYYLNTKISRIGTSISDEFAFVFTLENNGRLKEGNGMMKYETKVEEWNCWIHDKDKNTLAGLGCGHTICLRKSQEKDASFYEQIDDKFDYHGTKDVVLGRRNPEGLPTRFTPKRIVVIQMN